MAKNAIHTDKVVEELRAKRQPLSTKCSKMNPEEYHLCSRADNTVNACSVYAYPEQMWRNGKDCLMADDVLRTDLAKRTKHGKIRVGQQKGRKKKSRR
jgi:acetyl-CoA carboxylase alpha subunit